MHNLYQKVINAWQVTRPTQYFVLACSCLLVWLNPATHNFCTTLDAQAFRLLNDSLQHSQIWRLFWGYLNHPSEAWLNVLVMVAINIMAIFSLARPKRLHAFANILYFWLFFQMVLFVTHWFFSNFLEIHRASPTVVLNPSFLLTQALNMPNLKVSSHNCFPAGHALIAVYWSCFSRQFANTWLQGLITITALFLILPRMFSGAHWLSDIIFTIFYGLFWFAVARMSIFKGIPQFFEKILNSFNQKTQGAELKS